MRKTGGYQSQQDFEGHQVLSNLSRIYSFLGSNFLIFTFISPNFNYFYSGCGTTVSIKIFLSFCHPQIFTEMWRRVFAVFRVKTSQTIRTFVCVHMCVCMCKRENAWTNLSTSESPSKGRWELWGRGLKFKMYGFTNTCRKFSPVPILGSLQGNSFGSFLVCSSPSGLTVPLKESSLAVVY